jgi:hypothetical protein
MADIERFIEKINILMAACFTRKLARATDIFRAGFICGLPLTNFAWPLLI